MDYIPVFAGDDEDGSDLKLSPGRLQRTGVRSEAAAMRDRDDAAVRAAGTVQLDETAARSVIALRFDAYVDKVENVTTGIDRAAGSAPDACLRPRPPGARRPVPVGPRTTGRRRVTLRNARRRLENYAVPPSVIAEIDRTHEIPPTWPGRLPRTGIVVERTAIDGMKASAGESLFRLADISVVWVGGRHPRGRPSRPSPSGQPRDRQAARLRPRLRGQDRAALPVDQPQTRTARVRVELPNPDGALLPDMYADVEIATGVRTRRSSPSPTTRSSTAATIRCVIVDKGEGRLEPRPVRDRTSRLPASSRSRRASPTANGSSPPRTS